MRKIILTLLFLLPLVLNAQNDAPKNKQRAREEYEAFRQQAQQQYNDFRRKVNAEYVEFVKKAWKHYKAQDPIPLPKDEPVPPITIPEGEIEKPIEDYEVPVHQFISPVPVLPQPAPPIHWENHGEHGRSFVFEYYGTQISTTLYYDYKFKLGSLENEDISAALKILSTEKYDQLISECLRIRTEYALNDWAYLRMLDECSKGIIGEKSNEATLLMAWLYCQSGYKMLLARSNNTLHILFATDNILFGRFAYTLNNNHYYVYGKDEGDLYITDFFFPKEQSLSFGMYQPPLLDFNPSKTRAMQSKAFPDLSATTVVNSNLIDFYNDYPCASESPDVNNSWVICANTPLSEASRKSLYPSLLNAIKGKSKLQATEELLNFVQSAIVYGYDDSIWGYDRTFFPEESLFYPFADCEDHAILFSRLVRDLLGLKVVLIYYPGQHLATAIRFEDEQPHGDYIDLDDGRYFIADPTYKCVPIGQQMPDLRNKEILVVWLE